MDLERGCGTLGPGLYGILDMNLREYLLPRTRVNRVGRLGMAAKEENWSIEEVDRHVQTTSLLSGRFFFVILCNQEESLIG